MKSILTFLVLNTILSSFTMAQAGELPAPRWIYENLAAIYPEFIEPLGGFSAEISLKEIICYSENSIENGEISIITKCIATNLNDQTLERNAPELYMAFINSGLPLDRTSEAGTTYISIQNLSCAIIDPKPMGPNDLILPEYECTVED